MGTEGSSVKLNPQGGNAPGVLNPHRPQFIHLILLTAEAGGPV